MWEVKGLWYHELSEKVKMIDKDVDELIVNVKANWFLTLVDIQSKYENGR